MSEAVVVHHEDPMFSATNRAMSKEIEDRKMQVKVLEESLAKKELAVRRALDEQKLLNELHSINQLTKRKLDGETTRENRMAVPQESLDKIIALEDALKLEDKKSQEIDKEMKLATVQLERTETAISTATDRLAHMKDVVGWDRYQQSSRGYTNSENLYREHQKLLAKLEQEQINMQAEAERLSGKIEALTAELEKRKEIDDEITQAKLNSKERDAALTDAREELESLQRIARRKEKMLATRDNAVDGDYKTLKQLEGDKMVLHAEISKKKDAVAAAEKAILAQDVKLRQLEGKIYGVVAFLKDHAFTEGGSADRSDVMLDAFNQLHEELVNARYVLSDRDAKLQELDSQVEFVEKKAEVFDQASSARLATLANSEQEQKREQLQLELRAQTIQNDFDNEHRKLSEERERLEKTLKRITRATE